MMRAGNEETSELELLLKQKNLRIFKILSLFEIYLQNSVQRLRAHFGAYRRDEREIEDNRNTVKLLPICHSLEPCGSFAKRVSVP